MAVLRQDDERVQDREAMGKTLKRRGILAAAGAAVAGIVAQRASQPVAALDPNDVVLGSTANAADAQTVVTNTSAASAYGPAIFGSRSPGFSGAGSLAKAGVHGACEIDGGYGVIGSCDSPFGVGVSGESDSYLGVKGASYSGIGVYGTIGGGSAGTANTAVKGEIVGATMVSNTVAVHGSNGATGAGGVGVAGTSTSGSGVVGGTGSATPGTAGGYFYTTVNNGSGVIGQCFNPGGGAAAFVGAAVAPNYAAYFTGDVVVTGNFIVGKINGQSTGGGKSAAVANKAGGGHSLVYCVESPDSWFEDFGEGQIVAGKGEVKPDPRFMALIHTDSYHVFLTGHDEHHHLIVKNRGPHGFAVEADGALAALKGKKASDLSGTFSWRVVGKRSDTTLERFAPFAMPTIRLPDKPLFDLSPPAPPKKP